MSNAAATRQALSLLKKQLRMRKPVGLPLVVCTVYVDNIADANNVKRGSMNMADDIRYTKYPSYEPYAKYVPYSSAVEEAAAKMNMAKRHEMKVGTTGSIMVEAATMVKDDFKGDNENPALGTGYGTYE
jgi:putative salt-induced outer membrane protein YdiY